MRHFLTAIVASANIMTMPALAGDVDLATEFFTSAEAPIYLTHAPGDSQRIFILERDGRIRIHDGTELLDVPMLNIITKVSTFFEGGLLGIAFHPQYQDNGRFYLNYTAPSPFRTVIEEYTMSDDPNVADPDSARIILTIGQPASNHNAGWIDFGPDGYLYIPLGDGGSSGTAQSGTQLLGKLLRIDVDSDDFPDDDDANYAIPADNPYVGSPSIRDEVFGIGLRNPFRSAFDDLTGDLYMGDVGGGSREEVSVLPAGTTSGPNFGWPCEEGLICGFSSGCMCGDEDLVSPIVDYSHTFGCAIVGGEVYRGCAIPDLDGTYFYADYCTSRVWTLTYDGSTATAAVAIQDQLDPPGGDTLNSIVAIGKDAAGELYIVELSGDIYKIVSAVAPTDTDGDGVPNSCEPQPCPGDLDGDETVGPTDLALLLGDWASSRSDGPDLNGDGVVGPADLALLLGDWGSCG